MIDPTSVNIAKSGASNDLICRETIKWIVKNGSPDYVVVQWTFVNRTEILLDDTDKSLFLTPEMIKGKMWTEFQPIAQAYYEKVHSTKGAWSNYFKNMFLLQEFLENRNIQYKFFRVQPIDIIQRRSIEPWKGLCKDPFPHNLMDDLGGFRKLKPYWVQRTEELYSGSHPSAEGHRKIAEVIKNAL